MPTTDQIIAEARTLIGLPYRHLGRGPFAVDCLGVLIHVLKASGLAPADFDFTNYGRVTADYELEQHLDEADQLERLATWHEAQPGDVLLQRFRKNLPASHLIIVTAKRNTSLWGVHAGRRGVVEVRVAHVERNLAAYRLKEVAHG
jgi:cell wall-associated NlpC family hydrolase